MAGGKETPRQKMIGMMYLVLTALLALNVSKQILQGFITVNASIVESKTNMIENNKRVTDAFRDAIGGNPGAKPYFEKIQDAQKDIQEVYGYLKELKFEVIKETEKIDVPFDADTFNLKRADKIDDFDTPTHILIGDESNPKTDPISAMTLKSKMLGLHDKLIAMLDKMQGESKTKLMKDDYEALKRKIASIKPIDTGVEEDGVKMTWVLQNFYHLPMAAVVTNLNKMQSDLKNVEAEMLQVFSGASGKLALKFDNLSAKVIAPSSYIQQGQPYTADIFLAASSSSMTDDQMQVLVGVDSASAAKGGNGGSPIKIVGGMGKYESGGGAVGEQTYQGVIKFKNPDGTYKYYPFTASYIVAAPSVAVEPEKMNVFYIGVDNPLIISAAGVAPTDMNVVINGGGAKLTSKGGGKYIVTCTTAGECTISVSAKTKEGSKQQGPPKKFRVKRIPDPIARLGNKVASGVIEMRKIELASIGGVGAELPGFDFDVKFPVVGFTFSANVKGNIKEYVCNGPNLSPEAKNVLTSMGPGGKAFFEDIKVKAPDGSIRKLPTASLKVK